MVQTKKEDALKFFTLDEACDFIKIVDSKVIVEYNIVYIPEKISVGNGVIPEHWIIRARIIIRYSMGKTRWIWQ